MNGKIISPFSLASDVEFAVKINFLKGSLEHLTGSDQPPEIHFEVNSVFGTQLISDAIFSLLQVTGTEGSDIHRSAPHDLVRNYFELSSSYSVIVRFCKTELLTEDRWITRRDNAGKAYRVEILDDNFFGNEEVLGGSYLFVKQFANSKTHEVHHLIPAYLLRKSGILGYYCGPCIRIEKEDHKKTRSYKKPYMLEDEYFVKQMELLMEYRIRDAIEMEIIDLRAKFGSKYDQAFNEALIFASKLEEHLKKGKKGVIYA